MAGLRLADTLVEARFVDEETETLILFTYVMITNDGNKVL